MTQAERLIRNLCEACRLVVTDRERTNLKGMQETTPWRDLPESVRKIVIELRFLSKREDQLKKRLTASGFHAHYGVNVGKSLHRTGTDQEKTAVRARAEKQRTAIQTLRNAATIEALGKTAVQAHGIILKLQIDLNKIEKERT